MEPTFSNAGRVDNACPNCHQELIKRPGRKTKCPHCGTFIYVRTRPLDRKRVLVTADEARRLQAEWVAFHEFGPPMTAAALSANRAELEKHRRQILAECHKSTRLGIRIGIQILPSPGCSRSLIQERKTYSLDRIPQLPLDGCDRFQLHGCACCYTPVVLE